LKKLKPHSDSP